MIAVPSFLSSPVSPAPGLLRPLRRDGGFRRPPDGDGNDGDRDGGLHGTRPGWPHPVTRHAGGPRGGCVVIHCAETVKGGVGTYLRDLSSVQREAFGPDGVWLVVPSSEAPFMALPAGVRCVAFRDSPRRVVRAAQAAWHTLKLVRRLTPRVVHVHSTFAGALVRPLLALARRVPAPRVVYCAHGWAFDRRVPRWMNALAALAERLLARCCDRIVCISRHEYRQAVHAGLPGDKLVVVPNGIAREAPDPLFAPVPRGLPPEPQWPAARPDALRLLFVGRFDRQKGIDLLAEALRRIGPRACACAAGEAAVDRMPMRALPGTLRQLGWLSPPELSAWLAACDAVVMPSRWEGFGLVAVEAMRAGRAVIAARVGGLVEVVEDGCTGVLVPPEDAGALAQALARMDREQLHRMGREGYGRFLRYYTLERVHETLSHVYALHGNAAEPRRNNAARGAEDGRRP